MSLRFLWLIELDHHSRMRHGGSLRWFNLSRELILRGHHVHFAINRQPGHELAGRRAYLEELRQERVISGFVELDYAAPAGLARAANLLTSPALVDACLRRRRAPVIGALRQLITRHEIDVCLVSDRALLFAVPPLTQHLPVVIDWTDSFVLHGLRNPVWRGGFRPSVIWRGARDLATHFARERYYTRRASASLVVSPVDKRCLDAISRVPSKTRVLLNGIEMGPEAPRVGKEPARLIFTGNMNFPPNYEAALWFIDKVLPLIARKRPEVTFIVAGRNPVQELQARAGERVVILASVDDMGAEIARSALYVAPLVSGGGFKNKILEAIASGTYLVTTRVAVEFLPDAVREKLLVAGSAEDLARQVLAFLDDPAHFNALLPDLREFVRREFTWAGRATELLDVVSSLAPRLEKARAG
jgi:glycosyltransferase involved in cell wall biosynthesis